MGCASSVPVANNTYESTVSLPKQDLPVEPGKLKVASFQNALMQVTFHITRVTL